MKRLEKARVKILLSSMAVLVLSISFFGFSYAEDPGIPDTVRFEPWGTYIPCPPCTGHAVIPVVVFNDELLAGFWIPLELTGPACYESTEFTGRALSLQEVGVGTFDYNKFNLAGASGGDPEQEMPPGNGIIAYIHVTLNDTGTANIEEYHVPIGIPFLAFFNGGTAGFRPVFLASEHHIVPQDNAPGDVNQNGGVDLADVVFLINYLFKNGPAPTYPPCADPNIDCSVSLVDVVYLINYLFRDGPDPQPGCAY